MKAVAEVKRTLMNHSAHRAMFFVCLSVFPGYVTV